MAQAGQSVARTGQSTTRRSVLNVGGGNKAIPIPERYAGWDHVLLDIDPRGQPDIVCDARELTGLQSNTHDAIYCSHNLEHYYAHDVPKVLRGFRHVLKSDGFAEIRVPDLVAVMQAVVRDDLDLLDVLYHSPAGPIMVRDVIYGYGKEIETSGQDFYAHKTGFGPKSLAKAMGETGFDYLVMMRGRLEIWAYGFKVAPTEQRLIELGLRSPKGAQVGGA